MKIYSYDPPAIAYVNFGKGLDTAIFEENLTIERAKAFMEKFFKDHFCLSGPHVCLVRLYKYKLGEQRSIRFSGSPEDLFNKFISSLGGDPR
jgi:hypothetical protein